jgi:hypothetical protein
VAARSKAWVFGGLVAGIVGSNNAACLSLVFMLCSVGRTKAEHKSFEGVAKCNYLGTTLTCQIT